MGICQSGISKYDTRVGASENVAKYASTRTSHLGDHESTATHPSTTEQDELQQMKKSEKPKPVIMTQNELDAMPDKKLFSKDEISKHNTKTDCWIVIDGIVYDVTNFLYRHPVSKLFILQYAGRDATRAFYEAMHSYFARLWAKDYMIGTVQPSNETASSTTTYHTATLSDMDWDRVQADQSSNMKIDAINIYPVKGMKGITVESGYIDSHAGGLLNDRIYCVIDEESNTVVNQLKYPHLGLIQPKLIWNNDIHNIDTNANAAMNSTVNDSIELSYFDQKQNTDCSIIVETIFDKNKMISIQFVNSTNPILAHDQGDAVSQWITQFIRNNNTEMNHENEKSFRFVRIDKNDERVHEPYFSIHCMKESDQPIQGVLNYAAINIASQESLDELNNRNKKLNKPPVGWDRFRVNIIVSGAPSPHFEDFCKYIEINSNSNNTIETQSTKQNPAFLWSRRRYFCSVPNVDQNTGEQTFEPQKTLTSYRNAVTLNDTTSKPKEKAIFFGSFYVVSKGGVIKINDTLDVQQTQFNVLRTNNWSFGKDSFYGQDAIDKKSIKYQSDLRTFNTYKLIKKTQVNHDCILFRFETTDKDFNESLRLKCGGHWILKFVLTNENNIEQPVLRSYTPAPNNLQFCVNDIKSDEGINENESESTVCNFFQILVKIYPNGKMTQYLNKMNIGDLIDAKMYYNPIKYTDVGTFLIGHPLIEQVGSFTINVNNINMICGGSGITPMYQVICAIHFNKITNDETNVHLFYANKTVHDILLFEQLTDICKHNKHIKVSYIVGNQETSTQECQNTKKSSLEVEISKIGRIDASLLEKNAFKPTDDTISLLCGPAPMVFSVETMLHNMGFNDNQIYEF